MAMNSFIDAQPTQNLEAFKGVKRIPNEEYYTSGHRTCQACYSAQTMRLVAKAAGPRTVVLNCTGCMYVANTSYYTTPYVVPWMHTQLFAAGAGAVGIAAAYKALMRKGKMKNEPINVVSICGDGGGSDAGLAGISSAMLHAEYNLLVLMYDNETYANTDIQVSGSTPWGAHTSFSTPGKVKRIMHRCWKKNMAGLMIAGHPTVKYVATVSTSYSLQAMNSIRKALTIGGPTFVHCLNPCPKGWDFDPILSYELGELSVNTGIWPLYEVENGKVKLFGKTKMIADGKAARVPVREYLMKQGRFSHFTDDDVDYFQSKIDEMWNKWLIPGVIPIQKDIDASE
jgi:pyruvate ferredoxin oxidoreductase beta subunit